MELAFEILRKEQGMFLCNQESHPDTAIYQSQLKLQ
jgi:hypothetical protein